jgi:uncharacterized protein
MNMLTIKVKVRAGAKERGLTIGPDGVYLIRTPRPPERNKANMDVLDILAEYFQVPRSQVMLEHGQTSKLKIFRIMK